MPGTSKHATRGRAIFRLPMAYAIHFIYSYGLLLQIAAVIHFVRKRPETYWLWIILLGGGLGSLVYLLVEALPDLKASGGTFKPFQNRRRVHELEWLVTQNPAPANYEELGSLYMQAKRWAEAHECFSRAITARTDSLDPFYRRAQCAMAMNDYAAGREDLERVVRSEANYDFYRAAASLAECYAATGDADRAGALFEQVTRYSTLTESQLRYAVFLASQQRYSEARQWAQRILAKRAGMPRFQRRMERPLFRKASSLLGELPADGPQLSPHADESVRP